MSVISSTWILLIFNKHYYQVQILNITTIHSIFIEWCFFFSLLLYVLHLILPYLICYFFCIFSLNLFYFIFFLNLYLVYSYPAFIFKFYFTVWFDFITPCFMSYYWLINLHYSCVIGAMQIKSVWLTAPRFVIFSRSVA